MKVSLVLVLISVFLASCSSRIKQSLSEDFQLNSEAIVKQKSCFSGAFSSYEAWMENLEEKNKQFDRDKFSKKVAKDEYEDFRNSVVCKRFQYQVGEARVVGFFLAPMDFQNKNYPVLIVNRGGNGRYGSISKKKLVKQFPQFVNEGYIVLASNYRQLKKAKSPLDDEFGGRDVDDVLALIDIVDDIPQADGSRIGMFGWSRGGMMAYLAAKKTDRIKAIVTGASPTDLWTSYKKAYRPKMENVFRLRIPDFDKNKEAALKSRSAVYWADEFKGKPPILIMHGTADKKAHPMHALTMARALQRQKYPYKLIMFNGGDHGIRQHREEVMGEAFAWFEKHL